MLPPVKRLVAALLCCLASIGCGGPSDAICDKLYDTCKGALVDSRGSPLSKDRCVEMMNDLQEQRVEQIAECVDNARCEETVGCF